MMSLFDINSWAHIKKYQWLLLALQLEKSLIFLKIGADELLLCSKGQRKTWK